MRFAPRSIWPADSPSARLFDRIDRRITLTLAAHAVPVLRIAMGTVFLWFGVLKFFAGLSPAEDLAAGTIETLTLGVVTPAVALPILALWETLIGLGLLSGRFLRATLLLLAVQMVGTFTPLILFPEETWSAFLVPTLEGQYIIKNIVIIGAAMVVGATVRGGRLLAETAAPDGQPPTSDGLQPPVL